jgi:DNA invertase Pin-like site-specific DNA recombinase
LSIRLRLIAYLRVSSDKQVDGYGLEIRRSHIARWAELNGHEIVNTFCDAGFSGTLSAAQRPALADALQVLEHREADGFVIARMDRLARELTI